MLGAETTFPDPRNASASGLLAIGGDLSPSRLIDAYSHGIFPWFNDDRDPIQWWSPDPRAVLFLDQMKISRSLSKRLRRGDYAVTVDVAFSDVVERCAAPRASSDGTWITTEMHAAYTRLFTMGYAHSVESWHEGRLVGGLYGISLGRMFFGESMFSVLADASKVALAYLVGQLEAWEFDLVDCQIMNDHLESLGACSMARSEFLDRLARNERFETRRGPWSLDVPTRADREVADQEVEDADQEVEDADQEVEDHAR